jgi:uncharacterized protein (DUF1810 family)
MTCAVRLTTMSDHHDLDRFIQAQSASYEIALGEIRNGAKRSHWMWYVFPQIAELGRSAMAQRFAISDRAEAEAYLAHPVLGDRLREITQALQTLSDPDPERVFGGIDAMKLRSSLTLFASVDKNPHGLFQQALNRWFGGEQDEATIQRL